MLVDATVAVGVVGRRQYQRVGVTAFKIACLEVMRANISIENLAFFTDNSSTVDQIRACEDDLRAALDGGFFRLPTASDFLPRLCAAAQMRFTLPRPARGTERQLYPEHCLVFFFLDVAALCSDTSPLPPSRYVATVSESVATVCSMVLHRVPRQSSKAVQCA